MVLVREVESMLSVGQVARRLGLSTGRVVQLEKEGVLRCSRSPLGRLFSVEDVERLARERQKEGERDV